LAQTLKQPGELYERATGRATERITRNGSTLQENGASLLQDRNQLTDAKQPSDRPPLGVSIRRALVGRCPNCGQGKLFVSYLKQVDRCAVCGEEFGHIRSDDAAPWLTILVVGHIAVPIALAVESRTSLPNWVSMTIWPLLAACMALVVLPRAKGLLLSVIWRTRSPGSERD
jgi:uncharacterized protein (DUF983 family)